jgi:hypothetical protein
MESCKGTREEREGTSNDGEKWIGGRGHGVGERGISRAYSRLDGEYVILGRTPIFLMYAINNQNWILRYQ